MKKDIERFFTITKRDDSERIVEGYCSTEALDHDGEIVKISAMRDAWDDYFQYSTLREMHQPSAVGKVLTGTFDDKGCYITAKVVDPVAWEKVVEGVYKGFSIGGKKLKKIRNEIHKLLLAEISLVDRPNNGEAQIELFKYEGDGDQYELPKVVEKGMSAVADFAYVLSSFRRIRSEVEYEYGSESDLTEGFTKLLGSGGRLLKKLTAVATANLAKGENMEEGMEKAHQPAAQVIIKVVTENGPPAEAPAETPPAEAPASDPPAESPAGAPAGDPPTEADVQKMLDARDARLEKRFGEKLAKLDDLETENAALKDELAKLRGEPMPMKGVRAGGTISKGDDSRTDAADDLNKIKDDDDPATMVRKIHATGGEMRDNRNRIIS